LAEHSTYAQKKLTSLAGKILNKSSALEALKAAQKPFSSVASVVGGATDVSQSVLKQHRLISQLEREVEVLQAERCQLEAFIDFTDSWLEHVCHWRATVTQYSNIEEGAKTVPYFVLLVHLESAPLEPPEGEGYSKYSDMHGFVVTRRLADFHRLHKMLHPLRHHLSDQLKLPSPGIFDRDTSEKFLQKAMNKLQFYMDTVMTDSTLCQSEAVYAFCCPTPEFLATPGVKSKDSLYSGLEGFGGVPSLNPPPKEDQSEKKPFLLKRAFSKKAEVDYVEDPHEFLIQEGGNDMKLADSFAEPLYGLLAEIFELRGVFKFFRQSLITFVRLSFGKSINKQAHEFIQWLFGDSMMVYYLMLFKESMWLPSGEISPSPPPRTDDQKHECRKRCKLKIIRNMPDAFYHLFGHQTSQQGVIKIFESFQDVRLNKHLLYSVFELIVFEVFPELKNVD
jgi:sorting nexin-25